MLEKSQPKVYQDFTGGLNDRPSPTMIKEIEETFLQNCVVNDKGILEKAKGYLKDGSPFPNSTDSFIRMLLNLKRGTSVDVLLMAAQDNGNANTLYKVDIKKTTGDGTYSYIGYTVGTASFVSGNTAVTGAGTLWFSNLKSGDKIKSSLDPDSAYTEIASVTNDTNLVLVAGGYLGGTHAASAYNARIILHKDFMPAGTVFNNKAIITNGSEKLFSYDNITTQLLNSFFTAFSLNSGKYIENHKNRVFIAENSTLYWSHVNDETAYEGDSREDVYPQDNGTIIGIKSFADSLIVFKNGGSTNSIYQVVGDFDQDVVGTPNYIRRVETSENIGVIAERSPVVHSGYLYFLCETGLWVIDQRMGVQKVTYNIENLINTLSFPLGPSEAKAYTFDSKSQWDTGTHFGTRASSTGDLENVFDLLDINDALQKRGCCAVGMDANKDVHVVYVSSGNNKALRYQKWLYADQTISINETIATETDPIDGISLDIRADGVPGVAYRIFTLNSNLQYKFTERISGSWISPQTIATRSAPASTVDAYGVSIKYRVSDNEPRVLANCAGIGTNAGGDVNLGYSYFARTGTTWTLRDQVTNTPLYSAFTYVKYHCSLLLVADVPKGLIYGSLGAFGTGYELMFITGSLPDELNVVSEQLQVNGTPGAFGCALDITSGGTIFGSFTDTGILKKRNYTSFTNTTLDGGSTSQFYGYKIDTADKDTAYYSITDSGSREEKYLFENSLSIRNTINLGSVANLINPGDQALVGTGPVFASVAFGSNSNELLVRRLAFRGTWTSPENSDVSLTSWGIYDVVGEMDNGATVTQEIALRTISPPVTFVAVVPGSLISTDPTLIFIKNRISFLLGGFVTPVIAAILDNYTGAGVDGKQFAAVSFKNELYFGITTAGHTANNEVLIQDRFGSFLIQQFPVSSFAKFKTKLYAGHSGKGDLLILQQGYNYAGSSYTSDAQFKEDFLGSIELEKDVYKIYVLYEVKDTGSFIFSYRLNSFSESGGSTWVDSTIDQTPSADTPGFFEIRVGDKCRSIQSRIQNTGLDNQMGLISYIIVYAPLHIR